MTEQTIADASGGTTPATKTRKEEFRAALFAAHKAILAQLVEKRPSTFAPRGKACWPLKIGIHEDIAAELPDATRDDISRFLRVYTNNRRYWRALKEGAPRLAIDGQPAGEVSARDAEYAAKLIAKDDAKAKAAREPKPAPVKAAPTPPEKPAEAKKPEPASTPKAKAEKPVATPPAPAKSVVETVAKPKTVAKAPAKRPVVVEVKKRTFAKPITPVRKTA